MQEGYRNKAEFAIGLGAEGLPTVGFRLSGYASGGALAGMSVDRFHGPGLLITMLLLYVPAMLMSVKLALGENKGEPKPAPFDL